MSWTYLDPFPFWDDPPADGGPYVAFCRCCSTIYPGDRDAGQVVARLADNSFVTTCPVCGRADFELQLDLVPDDC
jgi:hypothetical protein